MEITSFSDEVLTNSLLGFVFLDGVASLSRPHKCSLMAGTAVELCAAVGEGSPFGVTCPVRGLGFIGGHRIQYR